VSGPIKRIKGDDAPLPRPLPWIVRVLEAVRDAGDELVDAAIIGLRADAWFAIVLVGFGLSFLAIGVAVYAGLAWIVSRFAR